MAPVSVVIPCYHCSQTIEASVASVSAQTVLPAEVILVDDYSNDQTLERLQDVAKSYPAGWIRVLSLPCNGGAACARNAGWEAARQNYVAFLDADDTWSPYKLQLQMAVLKADPTIALIAHRMVVRPRCAQGLALQYPVHTEILPRERFLMHNPVPTASAVVRRDLPFRFNEHFRLAEDYLLWAQIGLSGYRCTKINQVLAAWHKPTFGASGLSGDLCSLHRAGSEARRELYRQGLITPMESWACMTIGKVRRIRRHALLYGRRIAERAIGLQVQ